MVASENNLTFSRDLDGIIGARRILDHPFYQAWIAGALDGRTLRVYAKQYFHHVDAYPRAIAMVYAQCANAPCREMLLKILAEESGLVEGTSNHPELWMTFVEALGVARDHVIAATVHAETKYLIGSLRRLCRQSYVAGLAALYVYERQIPEIAKAKIYGLKNHYGINGDVALRYLDVRLLSGDRNANIYQVLLNQLSDECRTEGVAAGRTMVDCQMRFLDSVERIRRQNAA